MLTDTLLLLLLSHHNKTQNFHIYLYLCQNFLRCALTALNQSLKMDTSDTSAPEVSFFKRQQDGRIFESKRSPLPN